METCFVELLPGSRTSDQWRDGIRPIVPPSPFQTDQWEPPLAQRSGHTGNRREKNRNCEARYGVRVKETRISTLLLPVKPVSLDRAPQVLQQVESLLAKLLWKLSPPSFFSLCLSLSVCLN